MSDAAEGTRTVVLERTFAHSRENCGARWTESLRWLPSG